MIKKLPFGPNGRAHVLDNDLWKKKRPISIFRSFEAMLTFQNIQKFPNFHKAYLAFDSPSSRILSMSSWTFWKACNILYNLHVFYF